MFSLDNFICRITYLSGLCSPVSRISLIRSRYWYSSCRFALGELVDTSIFTATGVVTTAASPVSDGDISRVVYRGMSKDVVLASK